jgi:hypothetical protein
MIRRRLLHAALTVLPALAISGVAVAQHTPPADHAQHAALTGPLTMDQLHQMLQDIPGEEYKQANHLKNEALHGMVMGADPAATEAKLKAFAAEYSRVAGTDPKMMEAHVLEVGAQLSTLAKDPAFQAHLAQLHASH